MTTLGINGAEGKPHFRKEKKVKPDSNNSNKMHQEELQRYVQTVDASDAYAIAYILVRRHPSVVMKCTDEYINSMASTIKTMTSVVGGADV